MESLIVSGGLLVFFISGLVCLNKEVTKRPTYKEADDRYKKTEVCDEIHKSVNEKLDCLPMMQKTLIQIETKMDTLIKNGK